MNLNQLRYFRTLADEKQYTKAASKLFISQPSLSNSMKSFEEEFDNKLFERQGHHVVLTGFGKMIYATVCKSLDTLDQGIIDANQRVSKESDTVRVACLPTAFATMLPKIIQDFKTTTPKTSHFILFSKASIPILTGLQDGKYDIGITSNKKGNNNLHFIPFYTEDIIVLVPKNHPLAKYHKLDLEQLNNHNIITYSTDIPIGETIKNEITSQIYSTHIDTNQIDEVGIAGLVASGQGIGVCADTSFLLPFDLIKVPLNISSNIRIVYIAYNSAHQQTKLMKSFLSFISAYNLKTIPQPT
ncbi:LysR family transcriptional regulator [Loigolactobacillus coryniformis]|uniref:LysR family transcriptional regulator n=1 Tax=Loigolactobacillus coryniformis TaxID=1610 RepID=UPI00201A45AC|nr:LysR family transcriptional regulator [Loigolactobacillus coryniformis]MCL5457327.1 LysR family transcriptional regulator [Loigolactobacillus coryniformis]